MKARAVGNAAKQSASSIWSLWSPTNTSNSWPQCKYENASIARPWLSKRTGGLLLQKPIPAFFPILPEPKCHPETDKSFSHTQSTQTTGKRRLTTKLLRLLTYFSSLRPPESRIRVEAKFFLHLALCELEMLQFALKTLCRLTGDSRSSAERLLCPRQRTAEHSRLAGQPIHPALQPSRDRGGGRASSRQSHGRTLRRRLLLDLFLAA